MHGPSGVATEDSSTPASAWIFPVLVLGFCHVQAIASVHVVNILVDPIKASLDLSDTQFSLLQGVALGAFAVILGLPAARVADQRSRRGVIFGGVLLWSAGSMLSAFSMSFAQLLAARALVGIGEIILFPSALSMLYDLSPPRRIGTAIGIFGSGGPVGAALALIGGGWLMSRADPTGVIAIGPVLAQAWRVAFAACGLMGLVAALGMILITEPMRRVAHAHRSVTDALWESLRRAWPVYLATSGSFVLLSMAVFAINAWVPTFLVRVHGFSYESAGQLIGTAAIVCAVLGAWGAGVATDWLQMKGRRDAAVIATMATATLIVLSIVVAMFVSYAAWTSAFLCVTYFCLGMPTVLGGTALQQIFPDHLRAQLMALHLLLINVVSLSIGPTSVALLTDRVFGDPAAVGVSIAAVTAFAGALAILVLASSRRAFVSARRD